MRKCSVVGVLALLFCTCLGWAAEATLKRQYFGKKRAAIGKLKQYQLAIAAFAGQAWVQDAQHVVAAADGSIAAALEAARGPARAKIYTDDKWPDIIVARGADLQIIADRRLPSHQGRKLTALLPGAIEVSTLALAQKWDSGWLAGVAASSGDWLDARVKEVRTRTRQGYSETLRVDSFGTHHETTQSTTRLIPLPGLAQLTSLPNVQLAAKRGARAAYEAAMLSMLTTLENEASPTLHRQIRTLLDHISVEAQRSLRFEAVDHRSDRLTVQATLGNDQQFAAHGNGLGTTIKLKTPGRAAIDLAIRTVGNQQMLSYNEKTRLPGGVVLTRHASEDPSSKMPGPAVRQTVYRTLGRPADEAVVPAQMPEL